VGKPKVIPLHDLDGVDDAHREPAPHGEPCGRRISVAQVNGEWYQGWRIRWSAGFTRVEGST
jgi:hypothetical protein